MSVGLRYLYDEIKKHKVEILGGEKGLTNKVRWTHSVENCEIAYFLQGEELVFTTGVAIYSQDELMNLVKKTHDMGASGIIIYTGKFITEINNDIIEYCDENNYPIFSVPWGIDMRDTMRNISAKIIQSEKDYVEITSAIKDALFLPNHKEVFMPVFKKIGYREDWKYSVVIIEVELKDKSHNIEQYMSKVISYIEKDLNDIRKHFFVINVGDCIIIVFNDKTYDEIKGKIKVLYIDLIKDFQDLEFYIGMDKKLYGLEELHISYEDSKSVLKINKILRSKNANIRYGDISFYKLLMDIKNKETLKEFYNNILGDLEVYDQINNTDYLKLLIHYFENNCKVNETANDLFIHRNTVNYKVNKIEEILDINLNDVADKSKIYLCLMIKNLQ